MPIKTTKHEMTYDKTTGRAIFNGRNYTVDAPKQRPFPERFVSIAGKSPDIEGNTLVLTDLDEIKEHAVIIQLCEIEEHTVILEG